MTVKTPIGKITASKETLNFLIGDLIRSGRFSKSSGRDALSKQADNTADAIFLALQETGYYDAEVVTKRLK